MAGLHITGTSRIPELIVPQPHSKSFPNKQQESRKRDAFTMTACTSSTSRIGYKRKRKIYLNDACLRNITEFLNVREWKLMRSASREWREACDSTGFENMICVVPSLLQNKDIHSLESLLTKFGRTIRQIDFSAYARTRLNVLELVFKHCPRLYKIKAFFVSGASSLSLLFSTRNLVDIAFEDASAFSPQSAMLRTWMANRGGNNLKRIRLWNAIHIKPSDVKLLVSDVMIDFCVSNCTRLGDAIFDSFRDRSPPLKVLMLRNVSSLALDRHKWTECFMLLAKSLLVLDLSNSVPRSCQFPAHVTLPHLESLYIDNTALDVSNLLATSKNLEVFSMHKCSSLGDEQFSQCIQESKKNDEASGIVPLQKLVVTRVSGTRVSELAIKYLQELPKLCIIVINSCRNCPRDLRLKVASRNAQFDLSKLAPGIRIATGYGSDQLSSS